MKTILQIAGIAFSFFILGYFLTYPYDLSYTGTENVKIVEGSYEYDSFDKIINRKEFENKVLLITIWEPFDTKISPFSEVKLAELILLTDSLKKAPALSEREHFLQIIKGSLKESSPIHNQLKYFSSVAGCYQDRAVEFVYIVDPDNDIKDKQYEIGIWKAALKTYKIPGYHFIMNPGLSAQVRKQLSGISNNNRFLPQYCIVGKQGNILDFKFP